MYLLIVFTILNTLKQWLLQIKETIEKMANKKVMNEIKDSRYFSIF